MKMKKRHLAVAVVAILALSSSTVASAEGGSHRRMGGYNHISSVAPIGIAKSGGVLTINTSSSTPSFQFDTATVTPHIDFDPSKWITHFDTSTATSNSDDEPGISAGGEDDFLPALPTQGVLSPVIPPAVPATPPTTPSWITKPHAKSNEDNQSRTGQSSDDSQD